MNKLRPLLSTVRQQIVSFQSRCLSQDARSSLFNKDPSLKAVRDRLKKDENPLNRYEADTTRFRTVKDDTANQFGRQSGSVFRAEMVYSADLDSVLSLLKRQSIQDESQPMGAESYEFYFACLDRIDILITEKQSVATRQQIV